jgi:hypothetical protein
MHIKPRPGFIVRDPYSREPLPEGGAEKPDTPYWRRRAATGDVVIVKPDEDASSASTPTEPETDPAPAPKKPRRTRRAKD